MKITKDMVYQIRKETGAGVMDSLKAIREAEGEYYLSVELAKNRRVVKVLDYSEYLEEAKKAADIARKKA